MDGFCYQKKKREKKRKKKKKKGEVTIYSFMRLIAAAVSSVNLQSALFISLLFPLHADRYRVSCRGGEKGRRRR